MFLLSSCAFGGGFVVVSLIKKKFVEDLGLLDEDEMLDVTAIAQSAPKMVLTLIIARAIHIIMPIMPTVIIFPSNMRAIIL